MRKYVIAIGTLAAGVLCRRRWLLWLRKVVLSSRFLVGGDGIEPPTSCV
jgi:hypothetical protein